MIQKRRRSSRRKRTVLLPLILILVVLAIIGACVLFFLHMRNEKEKPSEILKTYLSSIESGDYEKMFELVDSGKVSKKDFIARNQNIYEGIGCSNVKVKITSEEKNQLSYTVTLTTLAGEITYDNTTKVKKDDNKGTILVWDDSMIFPELTATDKVRIYTDEAKRGQILDRNQNVLAGSGSAYSVGLVPGKMNEDSSVDLQTLSSLLGLSTEDIQSELSKDWVTDDAFVPLATISAADEKLQNQLLTIPGIKLSTVEEKHPDAGYTSDSVIGKSGLEALYEKQLRGQNGYTILIEDEDGQQKSVLAYQNKTDGETLRLTIDITLQQSLYEQFQKDEGCSVAMNPYTGEVLALVSTPSYDTNRFILGLPRVPWILKKITAITVRAGRKTPVGAIIM